LAPCQLGDLGSNHRRCRAAVRRPQSLLSRNRAAHGKGEFESKQVTWRSHALSSHIESELGSHRDWSQGGIQDHLFTVSSPEPARKADLVRLVALLLEDLGATLVRSSEQNETDKHVHAPLRA
jgi:hypothetical protein